jgi:hypothetical protein
MDEDLSWIPVCDLACGDATIGTSDPKIFRRMLLAQAHEEIGDGFDQLLGPSGVGFEEFFQDTHDREASTPQDGHYEAVEMRPDSTGGAASS